MMNEMGLLCGGEVGEEKEDQRQQTRGKEGAER